MVWRATVGRPRAVCGAVVSRVSDAGARSRTCNNLLSLNRVYNYGMRNVIERRRFSELGDQQLLEQTSRPGAWPPISAALKCTYWTISTRSIGAAWRCGAGFRACSTNHYIVYLYIL